MIPTFLGQLNNAFLIILLECTAWKRALLYTLKFVVIEHKGNWRDRAHGYFQTQSIQQMKRMEEI